MKFKTATLGCKVNQYETQFLRTAFVANGWEDADERETIPSDVDFVLVNTCSVTAESDAKSRKTVARFAKLYPNAEIVVAGCFAASAPDVAARLPNVSEVVADKRRLVEFLKRRGLKTIPSGVAGFSERRRAYIKVQDGCRVGCAYCVIPTTRPYLASRPPEDVLAEARTLAANGYREIVLTGIHLGHYGLDFCPPTPEETLLGGETAYLANGLNEANDKKTFFSTAPSRPVPAPPLETYLLRRDRVAPEERIDLALLLKTLVAARLPIRIRLGSLEAVEVSDEVLRVFEENPDVLCPHFHLSMQSGDDSVLAAMRRRWSSAPFIEKCREIVRRIPDSALTTDVIVGFPGETNAQFERTCDVVRELEFSRVHIFRYSRRAGTVAAAAPNQIAPEIQKERAAKLQKIAKASREKFADRFLGRTARVLVEEISRRPDGKFVASGTTDRYFDVEFPLDDGAATLSSALPGAIGVADGKTACVDSFGGVSLGDAIPVRLTSRRGDVLSGERIRYTRRR